jgi:hypothetical protein
MADHAKINQLRGQVMQAALRVATQVQDLSHLKSSGRPAPDDEAVLARLVEELDMLRATTRDQEDALKRASNMDMDITL